MKVGLLTTLWGRISPAREVLQDAKRMNAAEYVAVCSPGDPDESAGGGANLATEAGWDVVMAPNDPLGGKLNAGFQEMKCRGVDAVMAFGSDDYCCPTFLEDMVAWAEEDGGSAFGITDMIKLTFEGAWYWPGYLTEDRRGTPIGPWRLMLRKALDVLEWAPYRTEANRGLDGSMQKRLDAAGITWRTRRMVEVGASGGWVADLDTQSRITDLGAGLSGAPCMRVDREWVEGVLR